MCLLLFAYQCHPRYRLVLASNRDEFYDRPTAAAHFWSDCPEILAGRDLTRLGAWLGVTRTGRFAALTNYRVPASAMPEVRSRGELVSAYLHSRQHPRAYLQTLEGQGSLYPSFNLLAGDLASLWYYSNVRNRLEKIPPGLYGLSNHFLNTPWPKVEKCRQQLAAYLSAAATVEPEPIFKFLANESRAPDADLPDTGVGPEWESLLSAPFVRSPSYGTRASAVLLIDRQSRVLFKERTFHPEKDGWKEVAYEFDLDTDVSSPR